MNSSIEQKNNNNHNKRQYIYIYIYTLAVIILYNIHSWATVMKSVFIFTFILHGEQS